MEEIQEKPKKALVLVPDFYRFSCQVLQAYLNCEGKIPQLVNVKSKNNARRSRNACPFLLLLVPNLSIIKAVIENVGLFKKYEKLRPLMAYIIVGDLLLKEPMSERLKSLCYPVTCVMSMEEELRTEFSKHGGLVKCRERCFGSSPRWVFVNSLRATVDEVNNTLLENGYYLSNLTEKTYDCFLDTVKKLGPGQYLEDFHLPGLLALPLVANVTHSSLFAEQKILLQDKASCLPPLVSGVSPGMTVVDACAAPGNKTILLANLLKGKGRLIAIDKDVGRFSLLKTRLSDHGVKNVRCINDNFTDVPHEDLQGAQVVLVDPSCSNSGVSMHTNEISLSADRIRGLAWMQLKLLSHALSIPGVQTVVYSTCSVHYEENEGVVEEALLKFGSRFELEDLGQHVKQWKHFGVEKSPYGSKVLRTNPEVDLCHGFFVAKFVAKPEVEECDDWTEVNECQEEWNENGQEESREGSLGANSCPDALHSKVEKKKKRKHKGDSLLDNVFENCHENDVCNQNSGSKKSKAAEIMGVEHDSARNSLDEDRHYNDNSELKTHKKKRRSTNSCEEIKTEKNTKAVLADHSSDEQVIDANCTENTKSKKKKNRKHNSEDCSENFVTIKNESSPRNYDSSENVSGNPFQIETTKEKKRRRKDVCVDSSFVNDVGDKNDDRKIRKETSKNNFIEDELFVNDVGNNFHGENSGTKAKKKKKANLQENRAVTNGIDCLVSEKGETKKEKKRKKNLLENTSDPNEVGIDDGEIVETKKEKRKKRKNLQEIAFDANEVVIIEDEISEKTKDKKKRKLDSQENSFDTNEVTIVTCENSEVKKEKKKKKKKKYLQDEVEIVEVKRSERTKEKRKKKVSVLENDYVVDEPDIVETNNNETKKDKKKRKKILEEIVLL